ncbi:phytanoyl-CoA dioxygenase family protein (plasmid) [Streptomyces sp. Qhu-G9]|uniref:phytanoyl-CoA dioxygenase family protein n=1 Tax=Streptomyces sp. Qhu-G9 TaxID=3452799 RepID=UPI0022AC4678|nr:phytanoyl-CoA dioxygenase family protein [Streptomyces aurantiacus]WAU78288.1 phytanoyl-CoA dioxygenase family protein [Streptomyces aurantiacus]
METSRQRDWSPLSDEERKLYEEQGYLHLKGLFTADEVDRGLKVVDEALAADNTHVSEHASFADYDHTVRVRDAVSFLPGLDYFLDHPKLIGPLMSLLNNSVQVLGTEVFVRSLADHALEYWHTDGGEYMQGIQLTPGSPSLQVKAQIFLTDVTEPNCGNFLLIPGSHLRVPAEQNALCYMEDLDEPLRRGVLPDDAIEVKAAPGDVLLFPYSLWHAVAPNTQRVRKTFIFRYGNLWHRPHDYLTQPAPVLERMSPRLRRMFGDFGERPHPSDFYKPVGQGDVMAGEALPL